MISNLVFYQLGLIALVCLFLILSGLWLSAPAAARPMTPKPLLPRCKHSKKPKPFLGLTRKPCCAACPQAIEAPKLRPSSTPVWSKNSCGLTVVVLQKSTEPFLAADRRFGTSLCLA